MYSGLKVSDTQKRLKQILEERKMKQADILVAAIPYAEKHNVRIGKNDISAYVNGKYCPAQDKIAVLSLALDVSEAWLMGLDVPMNRDTRRNGNAPTQQDERTAEVLRLFTSLSPEQQETAIQVLRGLLAVQKRGRGSQEKAD